MSLGRRLELKVLLPTSKKLVDRRTWTKTLHYNDTISNNTISMAKISITAMLIKLASHKIYLSIQHMVQW